jgi:spore cortex formation protein SpoVR/YcgB (stage V sporulation)
MKIRVFFTVIVIMSFLLSGKVVNAQVVKPKEVVKEQGTNRVNNKIEQGVDAGFNKIEEGVGSLFKKKKGNSGEEEEVEESDSESVLEDEEQEAEEMPAAAPQKQKLESYTQYDFVPGDKILYFEDFSQDAVGDFPALWTSTEAARLKPLISLRENGCT